MATDRDSCEVCEDCGGCEDCDSAVLGDDFEDECELLDFDTT